MTDREGLIDALRALGGVADAEIVDDERGIGTLRLTLVPGADEVEVAVRVNAVLRQRFGLAVDSGKVQVVEETWTAGSEPASATASDPTASTPTSTAAPVPPQVRTPATDPDRVVTAPPSLSSRGDSDPASPQQLGMDAGGSASQSLAPGRPKAVDASRIGRRISIRRLQLVSTTTGISTAVSLGLGARTVVGEAEAGSAPESVQRAVALATLRAVQDVLDGRATLELVHVEVAPIADAWVALVVTRIATADGREDRLTGAAVVREDVRQAVIRATLDAVNRRVDAVLAAPQP